MPGAAGNAPGLPGSTRMEQEAGMEHDYDWLVIGSGFRVAVLEAGRRFADQEFAERTWDARRYYWLPQIGLKGIMRLTFFRDIFIVSGSGVGGGSLGYANTLYRARPAFYDNPQWSELADWRAELKPFYA